MSNRGTGPSWDDEQIAKYGLFGHLDMVAAPLKQKLAQERAEQVRENIEPVLTLLQDYSEETALRASLAIPDVIGALALGDKAMQNWQEIVASRICDDWSRRTDPSNPIYYFDLPPEEQSPFLKIVEVIIEARGAHNTAEKKS